MVMAEKDLFGTGPAAQVSMDYIDGQVPFLTVDGIFADPSAVRAAALALPYSPAPAHYPGRLARFPAGDDSLTAFLQKVCALVTRVYLPRLPPLPGGARLPSLRGADSDFAITDTHPSELRDQQREPHLDAVPVFGLVNLNEEPRGGTLFFRPRADSAAREIHEGYPSRIHDRYEVCGHIEGLYN